MAGDGPDLLSGAARIVQGRNASVTQDTHRQPSSRYAHQVRVDARNAILAKALPKIYGDKLAVESKHELVNRDGQPVDMIPVAHCLAFIPNRADAQLADPARASGRPTTRRTAKHRNGSTLWARRSRYLLGGLRDQVNAAIRDSGSTPPCRWTHEKSPLLGRKAGSVEKVVSGKRYPKRYPSSLKSHILLVFLHLALEARTGDKARIRQSPEISVVLSDIQMPGGMDGVALARSVDRDCPPSDVAHVRQGGA
jgi:hypothetical protein